MARKTPWHQTLLQLVSEHRAPPGGRRSLAPKPKTLAKRAFPLLAIALVAALAAGVLFVWPGGNAEAQDRPPDVTDAVTTFDYPEKGTGPIITYTAEDVEDLPVFWTLGGPDAADFTIEGGTLRFKSPPDYEVPTDRVNDEDADGRTYPEVNLSATPPQLGEGARNNVYKIMVRVSAGGEDGAPGELTDDPPDIYDGDDLREFKVTVRVTNVDEPGMVAISPMQPQVGTLLTAILTDKDNVAPGVGEWQWARSDSMTGPWDPIPALSNRMTYRPTIDDLNMYLQVTVVYVDRAGPDRRRVQGVSTYKVRKDTITSNQPPKFPDQSTLIAGGSPTAAAPESGRMATDRFILETAAAGDRVGAPVTAIDDKSDIEVLTYSLRDAGAQVVANDDFNTDTPTHSDGDAMSFDIDEATGQITVSARAMLDADDTADNNTDGDATTTATNPYTVVVRAVDGDGDTKDITVTIHVLHNAEPPVIDRVYEDGRVPPAASGVKAGDRVPTEMSHYETDRTPRSATRIDTDLDTSILVPNSDPPALVPDADHAAMIQPATYFATDPDARDTLKWTLDGPDWDKFAFEGNGAPKKSIQGSSATLRFASGPDFEEPGDANKDNVYEVTIVVMDRYGLKDELDVTVKVINSKEDNRPGKVTLSNRQPEAAAASASDFVSPRPTVALTAKLEDKDTPIREQKWQWYRSVGDGTPRMRCAGYNPHAAGAPDGFRYFLDTEATEIVKAWEEIPGASGEGDTAIYTPSYDTNGGTLSTSGGDGSDLVQIWSGGDITLTRTTKADNAATVTNEWSDPKCLRVAFTYRDGIDRTHTEADPDPTDDVDQTLEGIFMGSEYPVKGQDWDNEAPVFLGADGEPTPTYRTVDIAENTPAGSPDRIIKNQDEPAVLNLAATDLAEGEDDTVNDILTYSLSGPDAAAFTITGTVDTPGPTDPHEPDLFEDGVLRITAPLNFESKREYRVKITATDPSGDTGVVDVIVNITDVNEYPKWVVPPSPLGIRYEENRTDDVATYYAMDAERPPSGVTYSLVTEAITGKVEAADFVDHAMFEIGSISGDLSFKASPNYEDPKDMASGTDAKAGDNVYHVTVKAEVADDENPRHYIIRKVKVWVDNVNEAPVFSKTGDTLEIAENPDDLQKEPPAAPGYLYLLNRGVGKPAANLPAEPNLDVGIPMVAVDDDNTFTATNYTSYDDPASITTTDCQKRQSAGRFNMTERTPSKLEWAGACPFERGSPCPFP